MSKLSYWDQAEECRLQAMAYLGRSEGTFLLRVARAFEELATGHQRPGAGLASGESLQTIEGGKQDVEEPDGKVARPAGFEPAA